MGFFYNAVFHHWIFERKVGLLDFFLSKQPRNPGAVLHYYTLFALRFGFYRSDSRENSIP